MKYKIFLFLLLLFTAVNKNLKAQQVNNSIVPGVVVDYSPSSSEKYIGSPSICILPNGDYIASHDFFGIKSSEHIMGITLIFCSKDKGKTWKEISEIKGQFWSTLFVHNKEVYIIGTFKEYGNLVIRKSTDNGVTWTNPDNRQNGLLREGRYHTAPTPIIVKHGRIWRAFEHPSGPPALWAKSFGAFMFSAPVNSDLLKSSSWTTSNELFFDSTWLNGSFEGWLEGNAVVDKSGIIVDVLRVATQMPGKEFAAIIHISNDGKESSFNARNDFINFPGGSKKFTIRYDPKSNLYWTISNYIPPIYKTIKNTGTIRNTLALCSSKDLINWNVNKILLQHPDVTKHGFQYVDWQFDNKDLILLSRTAYDDELGGAHNYHDANFLTFYRIKNFRKLAGKIIH